jgi:hypothetical protein
MLIDQQKRAAVSGDNKAIVDLPERNDTELRLSYQHGLA